MKLRCSQCGGDFKITPTERFAQCTFCGSSLLVARGKGYPPLLVRPTVDEPRAVQSVSEASGAVEATFSIPELIFVPYWVRENSLKLAAPSLEALAEIPPVRAKPAGDIRLQREEMAQHWPENAFAEVEAKPEGDVVPDVLFYPYYRVRLLEGSSDEEAEAWVDGMDGAVLGAEPEPPGAQEQRKLLPWCAALFLAPVVVALLPTPGWAPLGAGVLLGLAYFAGRGR